MFYRVLLEIAVAAHFAFILFVVFGGALGLRRLSWIFLHLPCLAYGLLNELLNIKCPIAPFEWWLRDLSRDAGYASGFAEPFLVELIYPQNWTQSFGNFLAVLLLLTNFLIYFLVWRRWRRLI